MAKKQLVDFVNRLKESGIKVSFTKPKSEFFLPAKNRETSHNSEFTLRDRHAYHYTDSASKKY